MQNYTTWDLIKKIYKENFNIPPRVVDLMSIDSLITMCIDGLSNAKIADKFGWTVEQVSEILDEYLEFPGWQHDLDISPIMVYNRCNKDFRLYKMNILVATKVLTRKELADSFYACKKYNSIRKEIDRYIK